MMAYIRKHIPLLLVSYLVCAHGAYAQCYRFLDAKDNSSVTVSLTNLPDPIVTSAGEKIIYEYDLAGLPGNSVTLAAGTNQETTNNTPIHWIHYNSTFTITLRMEPGGDTTLIFSMHSTFEVLLSAKPNPELPSGLLHNGLPRRLPPRSAWSHATLVMSSKKVHGTSAYPADNITAIESCDDPKPSPVSTSLCTLKLHNKVGEIVKVAAKMETSGSTEMPSFAFRLTSSGGELTPSLRPPVVIRTAFP